MKKLKINNSSKTPKTEQYIYVIIILHPMPKSIPDQAYITK